MIKTDHGIFTYGAGLNTNHIAVTNFSFEVGTGNDEGEQLEYEFIDDVNLILYIKPYHKYFYDQLKLSLKYDILLLANLALDEVKI